MHLVYHPEFCITVVSNFSWVLQSSQDEIQNNGYPKFWEGKQGTIWSRWKWWMLEAYSIFFHSSHNFSLFFIGGMGKGGDIIHRYHRDIWRARTQARSGLAFPIHTLSLNKYITKKKCELTFGLYRRYALQAFGDSCLSLSNVCNAGWTL